MAWPPNPNKQSSNPFPNQTPQQSSYQSMDGYPKGQEWRVIEKTMLASVEEQRRARLWSIFFKLLTFAYLAFFLIAMTKGCSTSSNPNLGTLVKESHLAVIDVQGVIGPELPANSSDISEALTEAFKNEHAKAVVLHINSPGGSPVQSDEIWQIAMNLKKEHTDKKLYAVIGDVGASGAYYIASSADEILVNSSSLVGSIGVIMSSYNIEDLLDKVGVQDNTMIAGEYKDILSMSRPMTENERVHVQSVIDDVHASFTDAVKQGRGDKLKNPEENKLFSGLFWSGKQSIELGLADKIGSIDTLKKELEVDLVVDYSPKDPMQVLFDRFGVQLGRGIGFSLGDSLFSQAQESQVTMK